MPGLATRGARARDVTVVINTLDRCRLLSRALDGVRQLCPGPAELMVVVGPCQDGTREMLALHPARPRILDCPEQNLARSRNLALAASRTGLVFFLDDDAVPEPSWLGQLAVAFDDPDVAAAGGPIRDRTGITFQCRRLAIDGWARTRELGEAEPGPGETLALTGANFALRVEAARSVGGFDETYRYFLEETDLQRRLVLAGFRLCQVEGAEVHHGFAASALRDARRVPRDLGQIGHSLGYFCRRHAPRSESPLLPMRLAEHRSQQVARLDRLVGRGLLTPAQRSSLLYGYDRGVELGLAAADQPSRLSTGNPSDAWSASASADPELSTQGLVEPGRGIAILAVGRTRATLRQSARLARSLQRAGHRVAIVAATSRKPGVRFSSSLWWHRVSCPGLEPWLATRAHRLLGEAVRVASLRLLDELVILNSGSGDAWLGPIDRSALQVEGNAARAIRAWVRSWRTRSGSPKSGDIGCWVAIDAVARGSRASTSRPVDLPPPPAGIRNRNRETAGA